MAFAQVLLSKLEASAEDDCIFDQVLAYLIAAREEQYRGEVAILRTVMEHYSHSSLPYRTARYLLAEYEAAVR